MTNGEILGYVISFDHNCSRTKRSLALNKKGLRDRVKMMVGGGAIIQEFAEGVGADGYEATASGAVELARRLIALK